MNRPELVTAKELRPAEKSRMRCRVERISAAAKCSQRLIRSEQVLIHSETARELALRAAVIVRQYSGGPANLHPNASFCALRIVLAPCVWTRRGSLASIDATAGLNSRGQ